MIPTITLDGLLPGASPPLPGLGPSPPFPLSRKRVEGESGDHPASARHKGLSNTKPGAKPQTLLLPDSPSARLRERGKGGEGPRPGKHLRSIAIALGSNMGDCEANLAFGRDELARRGVAWQAVSSLYQTEPVGPVTDQPLFLNQVATGATLLTPRALLEVCLQVEKARGRERTIHWGPRTLDLDILLYGSKSIEETDLIVPHHEMANRAFVLVPLAEIAGDWVVPGYNKTVQELLATASGREGVRIWRSSDTK